MHESEWTTLKTMARLAHCNPFSPNRIELEKEVLGSRYVKEATVAWSYTDLKSSQQRENIPRLTEVARRLTEKFLLELNDDTAVDRLQDYIDVATYLLLYQHVVDIPLEQMFEPKKIQRYWQQFLTAYDSYFQKFKSRSRRMSAVDLPSPAHMFACLCQIRRAFQHIYLYILGQSLPAAQLRAAVWESIFTNNLRRYYQCLYRRLSLLPTLITGPSGTGKELIARAIGLSQYIVFDEKTESFVDNDHRCFFPLNLSAMSETLIESELFGHRKGSFTGAMVDRDGWLQQCRTHGAIFLDEIGELAPTLQVKLLRVVQQRTYARLGDTVEQKFEGKIIGATHRNMDQQIANGQFREDLYFRLCADRIHTPSLRQQLDHFPEDIVSLTRSIAYRLIGADSQEFADQAVGWIEENLGPDYPWRGNVRELEQCISSFLIRGVYQPTYPQQSPIGRTASVSSARAEAQGNATQSSASMPETGPHLSWLAELRQGVLTADQLLQHYCHWVYSNTGSYESTARQLGIDRRTVKVKIDKLAR